MAKRFAPIQFDDLEYGVGVMREAIETGNHALLKSCLTRMSDDLREAKGSAADAVQSKLFAMEIDAVLPDIDELEQLLNQLAIDYASAHAIDAETKANKRIAGKRRTANEQADRIRSLFTEAHEILIAEIEERGSNKKTIGRDLLYSRTIKLCEEKHPDFDSKQLSAYRAGKYLAEN